MNAGWVLVIGWISKAVLLLLVGLSLWSGSVIIDRWRRFKDSDDATLQPELRALIESGDLARLIALASQGSGFRSKLLSALTKFPWTRESSATQAEHAYRSQLITSKSQLEQGFTVLATLGSNAPFIGLFGTVLGIIQAFGALAGSQGDMNVVMFLIAEALIATAIGLFVAIPAVVAFNVYNRRLRSLVSDCDSLKELYLSRFASRESA